MGGLFGEGLIGSCLVTHLCLRKWKVGKASSSVSGYEPGHLVESASPQVASICVFVVLP